MKRGFAMVMVALVSFAACSKQSKNKTSGSEAGTGTGAGTADSAGSLCMKIADCAKECASNDAACLRLALLVDRYGGRTPAHLETLKANLGVMEAACKRGLARVCTYFAEERCAGIKGEEHDQCMTTSRPIYQKACDGGDGIACRQIARELAPDAPERPAMRKRTYELLTKACAANDPFACIVAPDMIDEEDITRARAESAVALDKVIAMNEPACAKDGMACLLAALGYMMKGDKTKGEELRTKGCLTFTESVMCLPDE